MVKPLLITALVSSVWWPLGGMAGGVAQERFLLRNAADLAALCATTPADPHYQAAAHFCEGYVLGVYGYQHALYSGPNRAPIVCLPTPNPTRNQTTAGFVTWFAQHPEYAREGAVETLTKFLVGQYSCAD